MLIFLLFVMLIVGLGVVLSRQMNRVIDGELLDIDFQEKDLNRSQKTPESPRIFGSKMQWIAVKTNYREKVAATLGLTQLELANWSHGLEKAGDNHVFLTPNINSWILAVGWGLGEVWNKTALLEKLSREYGEAQFFLTHEGAHSYTYIRYTNGEMIRHFHCEEGEILTNKGKPTDTELALDFSNILPTESTVLAIAAEWSVNPTLLDQVEYANVEGLGSVGYLQP